MVMVVGTFPDLDSNHFHGSYFINLGNCGLEDNMNTRQARKALPHRLNDFIACLKWRRLLRLHLATCLLMEIATVIQCRSYDQAERSAMVSLKSAIMRKDHKTLQAIAKTHKGTA